MIIRELFAKLGLSVDAASFAVADHMLGAVKSGLGLIVSGAVKAGEGLAEIVTKTVETAGALNDTSVALGVTTDAIQELGYAAKLNGSSVEGMSDGIRKLSINMAAAASGNEEAAQTFRRLGVQITANGKLREADEVFGDLAEKFKAMPDGARKVAAAVSLFGKSGASLIPTLTIGREELEKTRKEARDLGIVLDKSVIPAADDLGDSLDKIKLAAYGLRYAIAGPLLASLNESAESTLAWIKANRGLIAQRMRSVLMGLSEAIKAVAIGFALLWRGLNFVIARWKLIRRGLNFVIARWKLFAVLIISSLAAIVLGNAAAIISFVSLGAAAIGAAISAAAAWAAAAAPFVALAAVIAFVLLALEDLWVFLRGGKSLIGDVGLALAKLVKDFIEQGPKEGEHWMLKILRSVLIYLRAVGNYWTFVFGKIFDGVTWAAGKIDGLITRLEKLAEAVNGKYDLTGIAKRTGQRVLGALDSAGSAVGNAAEGATQRLFAPKTPMMSAAPAPIVQSIFAPKTPMMSAAPAPIVQSKSITATYAPVINQLPGQSATDVANESQRLWSEWMSSEIEGAAAAVGTK